MRTVAVAVFVAALTTAALAQSPTDRITLDVSRAELQIIGQGVMKLPYETAAPVINDLSRQLATHDDAAKKAAEGEKPKDESKPATAKHDKAKQ